MGGQSATSLHVPTDTFGTPMNGEGLLAAIRPPSILIVDDVPANLVALEAVLEPLGCQLVRASSGEEALKHILFQDFAVALIDVMMPGLDGLTTAGYIKTRPASRHLPIIFLTGLETRQKEIAHAYAKGAVD